MSPREESWMPRAYPPEFRRRAVELARLREKPIARIAADLGIAGSCLHRWLRQADVDDGPGCRRRADAAAPGSRGRDLRGRGPKRRVLRQADGGRAQTSLSWLADTLLSQDRTAPIRFCRPTRVRSIEPAQFMIGYELPPGDS